MVPCEVIIFNLLAGTLSDRFGRRRTLLLFSLIHVAASFLTTLASNYWFYIFVRFAFFPYFAKTY